MLSGGCLSLSRVGDAVTCKKDPHLAQYKEIRIYRFLESVSSDKKLLQDKGLKEFRARHLLNSDHSRQEPLDLEKEIKEILSMKVGPDRECPTEY